MQRTGGLGLIVASVVFAFALGGAIPALAAAQSAPAPATKPGTDMPVEHDGLTILEAHWGSGASQSDVRRLLEDHIVKGRVEIKADASLLGDPAPDAKKQLEVIIDVNGTQSTHWFAQGSDVSFGVSAPSATEPGETTASPDTRGAARGRRGRGGRGRGLATTTAPATAPATAAAAIENGPLKIISATYGVAGRQVDVTQQLRALVKDGRLEMKAGRPALQMDPAPGATKNLDITFELNGKQDTLHFKENDDVAIGGLKQAWQVRYAAIRKAQPAGIVVLQATFGPADQPRDVTDICQQAVSGDSLTVPAKVDSFGFQNMWQPQLKITYTLDGSAVLTKDAGKDETLQIGPAVTTFNRMGKGLQNVAAVVAELRKAHPTGLLILDARWGFEGTWKDLTDLTQKLVSGDSLTVTVTPDAFHEAAIWRASYSVTYYDGKTVQTKTSEEKTTLQIGPKVTSFVRTGAGMQNFDDTVAAMRKKYPAGLLVLDARIGKDATWKDLTDVCQGLVAGDSLTVPVYAEVFPEARDFQSKFEITYTDGTNLKHEESGRNATLQIGPGVTAFIRAKEGLMRADKALAEERAKHGDGLLILNAHYGLDDRFADVRDMLQSQVSAGALESRVGGAGWPDPAPQQQKSLDLTYWDGQIAKSISYHDGEKISLAGTRPEALKALIALPQFIPAGKPFTHNFGVPGNYLLDAGPRGAALSSTGTLSWTPAADQTGASEIRFKINIAGKEYIHAESVEVVSAEVASAVQGDLSKLNDLMRLDLANEKHQYMVNADMSGGAVLDKDRIIRLNADGISAARILKLDREYFKIAERPDYFVAVRQDPSALDLLDKTTGKPLKTIKLDYRKLYDLVISPTGNTSYVSADIVDTIPDGRVAVINESSGEVREPKEFLGTYLAINRGGTRIWAGVHDVYQNGTDFYINPDFNIVDVPTYGDIDMLLDYDLTSHGPDMRQHTDKVGENGGQVRLSRDGKYVTFLSFTGYPANSKNIAAWDANDFEKKPMIFDIKDETGGAGAKDNDYHPVLPLVVIPKETGVILFNLITGDKDTEHLKIAPSTLQGVAVRDAWFSPDGLSVILDCQKGAKFFLYRTPLILTGQEKSEIKRGNVAT